MNIDGITLSVLVNEISRALSSSFLKKVQMPSTGRFYFEFAHSILYCSLLSSDCYCCLTEKKEVSPTHPEGFIMLLRKYLNGGNLIKCQQLGTDRIMRLDFKKRNEIGDMTVYRLYFELMGRNSNLILTDDADMIIDSWKKAITERRSIIQGVIYEPYVSDGISILEYSKRGLDYLTDEIEKAGKHFRLGKFLQTRFQGFGRQTTQEILYRLGLENNCELSALNDAYILSLNEQIMSLKADLEEIRLYVYTDEEEKTMISPMPLLNAVENGYQVAKMEPSKALEYVNGAFRRKSRFGEKKSKLLKLLEREIKRIQSNIHNLEQDLDECSCAQSLQKKAELIMGNIYKFDAKKNYEIVDVTDWNTSREVRIELDKKLSISENVQRMFKKATKLKRRKEVVERRLRKMKRLLYYIEGIIDSIEQCENVIDLEEIETEMKENKLLEIKQVKGKRKEKETKKGTPRKFHYMGFEIVVGKNNKQNDRISRSYSREEFWFHAQNIPGSHVIINSAGREVPLEVMEMAAKLSARFSKGKMSTKIPVDYTKLKYVKKPKGSPPGYCIYDKFKTFIVDPVRDLGPLEIKSLKD